MNDPASIYESAPDSSDDVTSINDLDLLLLIIESALGEGCSQDEASSIATTTMDAIYNLQQYQ